LYLVYHICLTNALKGFHCNLYWWNSIVCHVYARNLGPLNIVT
jgi:hypothetical protein